MLLCPMEFSRQEYWSWLLFPTAEDFTDPGIEPASLTSPALAGRLFTTRPPGKPPCSEKPSSKSLQTITAGEGVEKKEPSYIVDWNVNWYSHYGEQYGDPKKTRNRVTVLSCNPLLDIYPEKTIIQKRYIHKKYTVFIVALFINSQCLEAT